MPIENKVPQRSKDKSQPPRAPQHDHPPKNNLVVQPDKEGPSCDWLQWVDGEDLNIWSEADADNEYDYGVDFTKEDFMLIDEIEKEANTGKMCHSYVFDINH